MFIDPSSKELCKPSKSRVLRSLSPLIDLRQVDVNEVQPHSFIHASLEGVSAASAQRVRRRILRTVEVTSLQHHSRRRRRSSSPPQLHLVLAVPIGLRIERAGDVVVIGRRHVVVVLIVAVVRLIDQR